MYDTLKKCDRLKEKWTRKVQILSKKQHSVTDLGLTLKHNCFFLRPNFIRIYLSLKHVEKNTLYNTNKKSLPERFQRLHDFPVK